MVLDVYGTVPNVITIPLGMIVWSELWHCVVTLVTSHWTFGSLCLKCQCVGHFSIDSLNFSFLTRRCSLQCNAQILPHYMEWWSSDKWCSPSGSLQHQLPQHVRVQWDESYWPWLLTLLQYSFSSPAAIGEARGPFSLQKTPVCHPHLEQTESTLQANIW